MSNAFTQFLGGVASGFLNNPADMKDYQHANRLYVRDTYARAPKVGFLYFVTFNINPSAVLDDIWLGKGRKDVGLLVKRADLPKFKIGTEVLNQYNRKTVVQTKLSYSELSIEFHDDNSNITRDLWKNYYNYYFMDGLYGQSNTTKLQPVEFGDTKYKTNDYIYGYTLNNRERRSIPFFTSIDIYVLHKGHGPSDFTQYTLINPIISDWTHDSLNQDESGKILQNKMNIAYEAVTYNSGKIVKGKSPEGFAPVYYDTAPSPLSIAGGIPGTLFGQNGVIAGAASIFGENGSLANAKTPLDLIGVALQTRNLAKGVGSLTKAGLKTEGYSILGSALGNIQATVNQPDGAGGQLRSAINSGNFGAVGNVGVNLFTAQNPSINNLTKAIPSNLTGGGP
jgi:hypothetical protein